MMGTNSRTRWFALALTLAVAGVAGCDDGPTEPGHDPVPVEVQLFDRDTGALLVYTHGTDASAHWDGEFPTLSVGEEIEVDVVFLDEDDEEIPLGGEFEARLSLASGAASGVIEWANHGDHLDIGALSAGGTAVVVEFWHGDHADWTSPRLTIQVAGS